MVRPAVDDHAQTDAGTHGDIDAVRHRAGTAPHGLPQCGGVYIRIDAYRDAQRLLKAAENGEASPIQLGGGLDGAVVRGAAVKVNRTKAADADGRQIPPTKKVQKLRHGGFRNAGGNADPLQDFSLRGADGAYHLCAAGLQGAKVRHIAITPSIRIMVTATA